MIYNPYTTAFKKYMNQFLGSHFEQHKDTIERISSIIITEQDFKNAMQMIACVYESGFMKAAEDYRVHFDKMGIKLEIKS